MIKLSTGHDSTLGSWRDLCAATFGETSPQTKFWDEKISTHEKGRDEEVIAEESQVLYLMGTLIPRP